MPSANAASADWQRGTRIDRRTAIAVARRPKSAAVKKWGPEGPLKSGTGDRTYIAGGMKPVITTRSSVS